MNLYYRLTPYELAEQVKEKENLEFISGKWFKNKKEIKEENDKIQEKEEIYNH